MIALPLLAVLFDRVVVPEIVTDPLLSRSAPPPVSAVLPAVFATVLPSIWEAPVIVTAPPATMMPPPPLVEPLTELWETLVSVRLTSAPLPT